MQVGDGLPRATRPLIQSRRDRYGVHVSHKSSNVLQLTTQSSEFGDGLSEHDRIEQSLGQVELGELPSAQSDELLAEILSLVHLFLTARLASLFLVVHLLLSACISCGFDLPAAWLQSLGLAKLGPV